MASLSNEDARGVSVGSLPPYEGEEAQINLGAWGKRLAESLCSGLRQEGFSPSDPVAEDWGWAIGISNTRFPFGIGCGSYPEY
jgi:hypothetical protein